MEDHIFNLFPSALQYLPSKSATMFQFWTIGGAEYSMEPNAMERKDEKVRGEVEEVFHCIIKYNF